MREFKSFFKTVNGNEGNKCNYASRLDTYGCGCQHDCKYCLSPDTEILMYDGNIKQIKDINIGDSVYGIIDDSNYKIMTKSVVTNKTVIHKKAYKITLLNGNTIICSGDHQWLTTRGWKFTDGTMSGTNRRPYLTNNNTLMGFSTLHNIDVHRESDDYKMGYLRGVIIGDANLKEYHYENRSKRNSDDQYHFRLILKDERITSRVYDYLLYFNIETNIFDSSMIDRKTKERYTVRAIRTNRKDYYDKIHELISVKDTAEFNRGFLAGIYDAEGSSDIFVRRIYNTDLSIISEVENALKNFGFDYTFDKDRKSKNKICKTIRLTGGLSENIRFNAVTKCLKTSGCGMLNNVRIKTFNPSSLTIKSIEEYGDDVELIDITTTTRNFIANGCISHNCYAKSLLNFRKMWNPTEPAVADIEKIRKKVSRLKKDGIDIVRLGGMTDCFQPLEKTERVTYETIKALNEAGVEYLIVTKSDMVADDEYIEILDKDLAHIQITVTTTDDDLSLTYEKAVVPSRRIKAIEKLQSLGYDVALRLSPFIPDYINFDILNSVKCDKIQVEFLRVNTWITKWFDIDYSDYTISQSGYRHLPLEKKKEYLKKITGFKEMSICEDESQAYEYWKNNVNPNKNDCCNLRRK